MCLIIPVCVTRLLYRQPYSIENNTCPDLWPLHTHNLYYAVPAHNHTLIKIKTMISWEDLYFLSSLFVFKYRFTKCILSLNYLMFLIIRNLIKLLIYSFLTAIDCKISERSNPIVNYKFNQNFIGLFFF